MHEASLHEHNSYITLTYDADHLPAWASLEKGAFPEFIRSLRKATNKRIRYFMSGEYGDERHRPHYHALLFGHQFTDAEFLCRRNGHPVYRSDELDRVWKRGLCEIGSVTFESAGYVARYVMKKRQAGAPDYTVFDSETGEVAQRLPEFSLMSRRPGIGRGWYDMYGGETYRDDSVVVNGRAVRPPRYYDKLCEAQDESRFEEVRRERRAKRDRFLETPEGLESYKANFEARQKLRGV